MNNNKDQATIPYFVHEGDMVFMERSNRRLWILCIMLIVLLVGTNAGWVWYESQFEDVITTEETTQSVTQDSGSGGNNTFIGGDSYGETNGEENNQENYTNP